jgi:hypothetical protein
MRSHLRQRRHDHCSSTAPVVDPTRARDRPAAHDAKSHRHDRDHDAEEQRAGADEVDDAALDPSELTERAARR